MLARFAHRQSGEDAAPSRAAPECVPDHGFTLIEITIAIVILATSLIVLLGLQASAVQRAVQDRGAQQAMLIGREILSAIEISKTPATLGDTEGSPEEVLRDVLGAAAMPEEDLDPDKKFEIELRFQDVELPSLGSDKLRRATLTIHWIGGPETGLVLDYFLATGL